MQNGLSDYFYIFYNDRKIKITWHISCKIKGSQLLNSFQSVALRALALETVERVSAILTLRADFLKKVITLKYCRFTCIYLASEPRISVVSAHSFANYADKDSKSCTSLHALPVVTLPVSLRGFPQRTT